MKNLTDSLENLVNTTETPHGEMWMAQNALQIAETCLRQAKLPFGDEKVMAELIGLYRWHREDADRWLNLHNEKML